MASSDTTPDATEILRPHAELQYAAELAALAATDDRERPPNWRLSPWAVVTYLIGGELADGTVIVPKYVGKRRLVEIAVATLATDRALLLLGVPGTAKTPPAPPRKRCDTDGTTPGCWPKGPVRQRSCRARSSGRCGPARSPASRN